MNLDGFLSRSKSDTLILARGQSVSRSELLENVARLGRAVRSLPTRARKGFVVIEDQNPIDFYSLLFALWENGQKVILPNLDYVRDSSSLGFHVGAVKVAGKDVAFEENTQVRPVDVPDNTDTVCFSSGSTGRPKGILHHHENFLANARAVAAHFPYQDYKSVTPLAPYLVSGVSHFLVHWLTSADMEFIDFRHIGAELSRVYQRDPECSFVGSPMHIINGLQYIGNERDPLFFFSSGDFMYPSNIQKVLRKFPDTHFFNVYGLAELSGRFFINDISMDTAEELLQRTGDPLPGIEYKLEGGEIFVDAPFLFSGYIRDGRFEPGVHPHPTGDIAERRGKDIYLIGRANDEVKIGGNKVSLKRVEGIVSSVLPDDVCAVFVTTHPRFGTLLALALKTDRPYRRRDVVAMLQKRLKPHEMPQRYYLVEDIPVTQSLKVDRRALREKATTLKPLT